MPMETVNIKSFRIDGKLELVKRNTLENLGQTDTQLKKVLSKLREDLGDFQDTMYAHGKYASYLSSGNGYCGKR